MPHRVAESSVKRTAVDSKFCSRREIQDREGSENALRGSALDKVSSRQGMTILPNAAAISI